MEEKTNKATNFFKFLKEAWTDPRKKAIVILGCYFVFFVILIAMLRINNTNNSKKMDNIYKTSNTVYSLDKLKEKNYRFIYEIEEDSTTFVISGEQVGDFLEFSIKDRAGITNYYKDSKEWLKEENKEWIKVDNPIKYDYILNIDAIENILDKATYISKTEYQDKNNDLNYEISTTTLCELIDNRHIDIDDSPNIITVSVNDKNSVEAIELDLSSYFTYLNNRKSKVVFKLSYNDIGNVKEILNPKE